MSYCAKCLSVHHAALCRKMEKALYLFQIIWGLFFTLIKR